MIGQQILHYNILKELGRGGMGVVYKAEDTKLKRDVAIKLLPRRIAASEAERERFKIEAQAAAALNHPNIATIYNIEEVDGELFIVMEYIEGKELREIVRNSKFEIRNCLDIASQIASGLQAAHEKGIVHRDIKSSNIMITHDGQVKIMDFGLAKIRGGAQFTKVGTTLGTAAYMSPEQAQGKATDHRTDIWAFGVVLYEMITGQLPFKGDYEQAVIYTILNEEVESPRNLRVDLSEAFDILLKKMLAKDVLDRYQSTEEVLAELRKLQGPLPSTVKKAESYARFPIRKPYLLLATAVVGLLVLLFLVWSRRESVPASTEKMSSAANSAIAVLPFSVRGNAEFIYLGEGMVDLLSTKLDGASGWRSVDPRAILGFVEHLQERTLDPESGRNIAQQLEARFYVLGNILEIGGKLQLNASLYDVERGLSAAADATAEGDAAQLFGLVDEVAGRLMIGRGQGLETRVDRIEAVTTSSLPALKAYIEGRTAFRRGQYQPAVDAFQQAVSADSSFALAYYRLSIAAEWRTMSELSFKAAQQALDLSDRLSTRDRRLLAAFLAYRQGKAAEAEQHYRTIVDAYPDDVEALVQLAEVLFHYNPLHGRSFAESQKVFERVLYYEADDVTSLIHLARIAANQGRVQDLNHYVEKTVSLIPGGDREMELRTLQAVIVDSAAQIAQVVSRLKTAADLTLAEAVWSSSVFAQRIGNAKQIIPLLTTSTRSADAHILGLSWGAFLQVATGEWQSAQEELDMLESVDRATALESRTLLSLLPFINLPRTQLEELQDRLEREKPEDRAPHNPSLFFNVHDDIHTILHNYLLGLLSARLGEDETAVQYAERLDQLRAPPSAGTIAKDLALSVRAHVDVTNGRFEQALARLEQAPAQTWYHKSLASPFYAQTNERFLRAECLRKLGRDKEALAWYENLCTTTPHGLVYLAITHLRRGEIYEKLGKQEQAVAHYSRFVKLWRDCDPELRPLLEKTRKRLSELRNRP